MIPKFLLSGGTLTALTLAGVPSAHLLIALLAVIVLDFVTGVLKSVLTKQPITSKGYRGTISKFVQYAMSILCGSALAFFVEQKVGKELAYVAEIGTEGLIIFIIYTEVTSIFENVYEMDSKSPFAQNFIRPVLRLLTAQIKRKSEAIENLAKAVEGEVAKPPVAS